MGSLSKPLDRSNMVALGESILSSPVAARLLIFMGTFGLLGFVLGHVLAHGVLVTSCVCALWCI